MTAVIALSKCAQTKKMYGIRFERARCDWKYTWAFPIQEKAALHEEYDKTTITGALIQGEEYPGCPYCGAKTEIKQNKTPQRQRKLSRLPQKKTSH